MRDCSQRSEADRNVNSKDQPHEVSVGDEDSLGNSFGRPCMLHCSKKQNKTNKKILSTFCLCSKTLYEAEFKHSKLFLLAEEISRHGHCWLLSGTCTIKIRSYKM